MDEHDGSRVRIVVQEQPDGPIVIQISIFSYVEDGDCEEEPTDARCAGFIDDESDEQEVGGE